MMEKASAASAQDAVSQMAGMLEDAKIIGKADRRTERVHPQCRKAMTDPRRLRHLGGARTRANRPAEERERPCATKTVRNSVLRV